MHIGALYALELYNGNRRHTYYVNKLNTRPYETMSNTLHSNYKLLLATRLRGTLKIETGLRMERCTLRTFLGLCCGATAYTELYSGLSSDPWVWTITQEF